MQKNKQLIIDFLSSEFYSDVSVFNNYLNPQAKIEWNGTTGLRELSGVEFSNLVAEMGKSFEILEFNLHNCIAEGNQVAISFSYDVKTVESDEVFPLAEFSCFWEIENELIIKGEMMSHRSHRE